MAKKEEDTRVGSGNTRYGPGPGESAADAYPAEATLSRDASDYVLVEKYVGPDGLRIEEQVLKSEFDESDDYKGLSLDSENVREAHPAVNRPTSDLTEEEAKEQGREVGQG